MSEVGIVRAESPPGGAEGQMTDQDVYMGVCVFGAMIKYINLNIFTERKQKKKPWEYCQFRFYFYVSYIPGTYIRW